MIACERCDVLNVPGSTTCVECGADLVPPIASTKSPPPVPRTPTANAAKNRVSRRDLDPEKVERSRQRQEFARIKNTVFTIRSVYWSGVIFAIVQLLIYHLILDGVLTELKWSTASTMWMFASWLQLALMVSGALLVVKRPFLWSAVGAGWWTMSTGYVAYLYVSLLSLLADAPRHIREDPIWDSISTRALVYLAIMTLVFVAFWFATAQARRIEELMQQNPELELKRTRRTTDHIGEEGIAEMARMRHRDEFRQKNASALRVIVIAAVALLAIGGAAWAMFRPPSAHDRIGAFEQHWAAGDVDAMVSMVDGGSSKAAIRLRVGLEQRGWLPTPPSLGEAEVTGSGRLTTVTWPCEGEELEVGWAQDEQGTWRIRTLSMPELQPPPIAQAITAFRDAWGGTGTEQLTQMVKPGSDRVAHSIARMLEARGLAEQREPLGESDASRRRGLRQTVLFGYGLTDIKVTFEYWHPSWRIIGFRPPAK